MMRSFRLLALLTGVASSGAAQDPARTAGWLAGCWEARSGTRVTLEAWMVPAGGLMLGMSRTTVGAEAREFEHLRLRARDGRLVYTALPSGQRETDFPATHVSDSLLRFENPAHDFPQRISYRRRGADSIVARVEGPGPGGTSRGFDLAMRRVSCTQEAPVFAPPPDPGPASLLPGDARLRHPCSRVSDTLELVVAQPGQAPRITNAVVRERSAVEAGGARRCVWTQRYLGPQSSNQDTSLVTANGLHPLEFAVLVGSSGARHRYRVERDSLRATVTPRDSAPRETVSRLTRPGFLATVESGVLEALPLAPGLTASFDVWRPPAVALVRVRIEVEAAETLRSGGRDVETWRVAWDDGTARTTYWITREAPRLLRSRTQLPSSQFWRRIKGDSIPAP